MLNEYQSSLLFGTPEVLVAAKHLLAHGAERVPYQGGPLIYYHLLLDHHAIISAHGLWTESLFWGDTITKEKIFQTDWDVVSGGALSTIQHPQAARRILRGYEVKVLMNALHPVMERRAA